jgi:hypothetical protein
MMSINMDIARQRLHKQRIAAEKLTSPEEVVRWFGAVQAQDYAGAKWAVGQRMHGATDADIDAACAAGTILRTHVMRPTWHFVTPADIRWLLALTAPRVHIANAYRCRQLGLDDATLAHSNAVLAHTLQGGVQLTRTELTAVLQESGIAINGERLTHIMLHAELEGIVCSGAWRGKQFTYALLDERAPYTAPLTREDALVELTTRYVASHGPATVHDFVWWSGLTMADAKTGLAMAGSRVMHEIVDGRTYWFTDSVSVSEHPSPSAFLLPNYDEFIVGYTDRSAVLDAPPAEKLDARGNVLFNHMIVIDGQVRGTWKRTLKKEAVLVDVVPFAPLDAAEARAIEDAAGRYGRFVELAATLQIAE